MSQKEIDPRNSHYLDSKGKDLWTHLEEIRQSPREMAGAHIKDILGYVLRFDRKEGVDPLENLEKAQVTLSAFIELVKRNPSEFAAPSSKEPEQSEVSKKVKTFLFGTPTAKQPVYGVFNNDPLQQVVAWPNRFNWEEVAKQLVEASERLSHDHLLQQLMPSFVCDNPSDRVLPAHISRLLCNDHNITEEQVHKLVSVVPCIYEMITEHASKDKKYTVTELLAELHNEKYRAYMLSHIISSTLAYSAKNMSKNAAVSKILDPVLLPLSCVYDMYKLVCHTGKHINLYQIIKTYKL